MTPTPDLTPAQKPIDLIALGVPIASTTLVEALQHYKRTITPQKRGSAQETYRVKPIRELLGHLPLSEITAAHVAWYRDTRLATPHPRTSLRTLTSSTVKLE